MNWKVNSSDLEKQLKSSAQVRLRKHWPKESKLSINDTIELSEDPAIITKPKVEIEESLLHQLQTFTQTEGQVIVHCLLYSTRKTGTMIRIWPSTFLFDNDSPHKSELVLAENISYYPTWQEVPAGKVAHFTLIFSALPKSCSSFDLIEVIPQLNGFTAADIQRNDSDVYFIRL